MAEIIRRFLKERSVGTLGVVGSDGAPRVATVFYFFDLPGALIFKSRSGSEHMKCLFTDPRAAMSVYDHDSNYKSKDGIQLRGIVERIGDPSEMLRLVDAYGENFAGAREKFAPIENLMSHDAPSTLFRFLIKETKSTSSSLGIADLEYSAFK